MGIRNQFDIFPINQDIVLVLLMQRTKKSNDWSSEEVELISALHAQFTSKRWKRIAEEFRARGFERSEIECREKWINFLDPQLNRKDWEEWELSKLYEVHEQVGTRWCLVQKAIGRTQNQIKNRFYGTLRNFIRFTLSFFAAQEACFNSEISHLSPSYLNSIYNANADFAFMGQEVKNAISAMKFRVEKQTLTARIEANRELYQTLRELILQHFAASKPQKEPTELGSPTEYSNPQNVALTPEVLTGINAMALPNSFLPLQPLMHPWGYQPLANYQATIYWYQ